MSIEREPIRLPGLPADGAPLHNHPDGQVRITGTRISLELFLGAYHRGAKTPEQLSRRFDTVSAAAAKAVLAYYAAHKDAVDEYLRLSAEQAERIGASIKSQPEYIDGVKRILERAKHKGLI